MNVVLTYQGFGETHDCTGLAGALHPYARVKKLISQSLLIAHNGYSMPNCLNTWALKLDSPQVKY